MIGEHTRGADRFACVTSGPLPPSLVWPVDPSPLRLCDQWTPPPSLVWPVDHPPPFAWVTSGPLPPSLEWPVDPSPLRLSDQWTLPPFAWVTSGPLPPSLEWPVDPSPLRLCDQWTSLLFAWVASRSLPSVQNYRPYIVFQVPRIFLFMAGYRNLHTFVFFSVICWSYLRTEISCHFIHRMNFSLSCETTLLMLSCDRIESARFIVTS